MNAKNELNNRFLSQEFIDKDNITESMDKYKLLASGYAQTENAIAVLSDLKEHTSYVCYGDMAETLGIGKAGEHHTIGSIWEEEIFSLIPPDEMNKRHLDELKFLHFLKGIPQRKRTNYYLTSSLQMYGRNRKCFFVRHRIFYIAYQPNGSVRLALCLYNLTQEPPTESYICNTADGSIIPIREQNCTDILSKREKDVLKLIDKGNLSKEIAETLAISIHTVNRHRQNILMKLQAGNSMEACRIAKQLLIL